MASLWCFALASIVLALLAVTVSAHGTMTCPPMRGITAGYKFWPIKVYNKKDTRDWLPHFPAGQRNPIPGTGEKSQRKAAGWRGWTLYQPTKPGFRFRSGPCGDWLRQNPGDHVRGGRYYNGGKIYKAYNEGGVISFDIVVTAHHNGYAEFRVCDADKCGGDITNNCLRDPKKCVALERHWDRSCESRYDKLCGPIDPKYPTRWYMPCKRGDISFYGKGKIKYRLPKGFNCKRCVVQFYWTAANGCNPPGVWDYFTGPRGPKWGNCKGQGDAIGGYRRWPALCDGDRFAEEYYQCGDIKINPRGFPWKKSPKRLPNRNQPKPPRRNPPKPPRRNPPKPPKRNPPKPPRRNPPKPPRRNLPKPPRRNPWKPPQRRWKGRSVHPIEKVVLFADGAPRKDVYDGQYVQLDMRKYKYMTFETKVFPDRVSRVVYFINDKWAWQDNWKPYVFRGNSGRNYNYWWQAPFNQWIRVKVLVPVWENGRNLERVMNFNLYLKK